MHRYTSEDIELLSRLPGVTIDRERRTVVFSYTWATAVFAEIDDKEIVASHNLMRKRIAPFLEISHA